MSFLNVMKADIANFKTADILVAVVFAVVARVYALFGSPLFNAWLVSLGPIGQFVATFAVGILYFILLLSAIIRRNMLVAYVASVLMAVVRVFTGDPFGPVAFQAYLVGGLTGWIAWAMMKNRHSFWAWMLVGWWYSMGVDFVFFTFYLPVAPVFGSVVIGWIADVIVYRIILGFVLAAVLLPVGNWIYRTEVLRGIVRPAMPPAAPAV